MVRMEGYRQGTTSAKSTYLQPGSTTYSYDANGYLTAVTDATETKNNRTLVNDAAGQILYKAQDGKAERTLIAAGQQVARYGAGGMDLTGNPLANINPGALQRINNDKNKFKPQFNPTYQAMKPGAYQGASSFVVSAGDTLRSIAQAVYGTQQLWYKIAEANGLSSDADLQAGQVLTIPGQVGGTTNGAEDFRPYDASAIVGDTTPNLPQPPTDWFAIFFMILVTVLVTIATSGALGFQALFGSCRP